jgi:hypothetical protein
MDDDMVRRIKSFVLLLVALAFAVATAWFTGDPVMTTTLWASSAAAFVLAIF